jgi:hypothetical protein
VIPGGRDRGASKAPPTFARAAPAVLVALSILTGACRRKHVDPATLPPVALVQDFERDLTLHPWPKDAKGGASLSTAWSADGKRSLRLDPGLMVSFTELAVSDWSAHAVLRFTVHNAGARTAGLGLDLQDTHDAFDERHQRSFGAAPGDSVIELDYAGGLWRGEENRPYRGAVKTPLDVAHITRVAFTNHGEAPLFIDRLEIVKVPALRTPGGVALDLGLAGKQVMGQTVGVFETSLYTPERGHGFLGPVKGVGRPMSYPTPLLGDGLPLGDAGLRVDLPGGAYLGWIAFERGGFWEGEQSGYAHADVRVNGAVVTGHDFTPSGAHFLFEDTELTDLARIEEALVRPAHAITRFRFDAAPGANVFTLAVTAPRGPPLRIAGLILAPDTPEGRAFLDAHERRQSAAVAAAFPPDDRARRAGRSAPAGALIAEPLPPGAPLYPRDLPEHPGGAPLAEIDAVAGQLAVAQVALHAALPVDVHVEVRPLVGPAGRSLPAPVISHGRYLPTRPLGNGPVWLSVHHYRPEPDFHAGPDLARAVLFELRVPTGTAPGLYEGTAVFTAGASTLSVPLRVRVHAVELPEVPIPVGLFMSALPFGPDATGEARWWELQTALLDEQARAGLSCVTGGPGLDFTRARVEGEHTFVGERALRYLALARARGMARAVVTYGGFFTQLSAAQLDPASFARAWAPFEAAHALPPFYFYTFDEPGTPAELDAAAANALPFTRAGLRTMGFFTRRKGDARVERLLEATYAPALDGHVAADLKALAAAGRHPWVYNNGMDRHALGLHLWRNLRAGAEGRLEWIGLITQGFAFDDLDGREPANGAWVVHDRLGVLPTPRWLSAREGLLDLRIRLALEKAVPPGDPALATWPPEGYGKDGGAWTDAALTAARAAMLIRIGR